LDLSIRHKGFPIVNVLKTELHIEYINKHVIQNLIKIILKKINIYCRLNLSIILYQLTASSHRSYTLIMDYNFNFGSMLDLITSID